MEDAQARKERLRALKAAAESAGAQHEREEPGTAAVEDVPVLKFRNYAPTSKKIEHTKVDPAHPPPVEEPVLEPEATNEPEQDLLTVAPKKANWDLRRDLSKKLAKLERRTQRAMIQLMQEQERAKLDQDTED
ncbi:hypothetical protein WJX72_004384 [[Myrmecia] bisecta]|uniref:Coiled-coil domain-containing protein 12 n=1 Tax=[Myrmecia] bisecta TaxID=41462 RepID=A0AAW1QQB4_9CHLO